jgi:cellulose synthase/poly-beta-1,6-N-acetylglucosamine synthase-like glycosyltransferase
MKVSVIVPVYDDPRIEACILSLLSQDYPKELYEIIVVDNNSNESTREVIQRLDVKYVREVRKGSYFARNAGLEIASGDIAAFIDADCVADSRWLSQLLEGFTDTNVGGIGGRILKLMPQTWVQTYAEDLAEQQLTPQHLPFHDAPYIVTANAAYRMSMLRLLQGFDAQFKSGGDVDLAWRVHKAGFMIVTAHDAIVYHAARETVKGYFKQFFNYAVGHVLLFKKHSHNRSFFTNTYSFLGLSGLLFSVMPAMFVRKLLNKPRAVNKRAMYIELVKYVAIICGNLYGAVKYRIPYF